MRSIDILCRNSFPSLALESPGLSAFCIYRVCGSKSPSTVEANWRTATRLSGTGFDQLVIDGLNLKRDAVVSFISEKRPTYPQFEQWVREQPGAALDEASIDKLNKAIAGYNHDDETRRSVLGAANLADDTKAPRDAVNLNNLDDWTEFHQAELK